LDATFDLDCSMCSSVANLNDIVSPEDGL